MPPIPVCPRCKARLHLSSTGATLPCEACKMLSATTTALTPQPLHSETNEDEGQFVSGYAESGLVPGEKVLYVSGLHWLIFVGPCLFLLFVLGSIIGLHQYALRSDSLDVKIWSGLPLIALLLIGVPFALWKIIRAALQAWYTEFAVTNKRVLIKHGIIRRRTIDLRISQVESLMVNQGIMGRLFGYGSIVITGTGGVSEPFELIDNPMELHRQVRQAAGA